MQSRTQERQRALGIAEPSPKAPAITDHLAAARELIKGTNLVLFTRCNSKGEVINYTVERRVGARLVFCGQRTEARGLYILVGRCKRTEGSTA